MFLAPLIRNVWSYPSLLLQKRIPWHAYGLLCLFHKSKTSIFQFENILFCIAYSNSFYFQ